jgi:hypothetical protein
VRALVEIVADHPRESVSPVEKPGGHPFERWFTPGRFAILIACLIAACFPGVLIGSDTFFFRDFAIFSYPLAAYHKGCFWHGQLPLWNPYNDCGLPFLAQWNTMVLYPLSLIYLLLPIPWSLNFFCLFHLWLGGVGMYFLARAWTRNDLAASLAGLSFLFNGVVLSCLKWPNNIAALGWMPWVVLCAERAFAGNVRTLALAALIGAVQMLSGAPEIIVLTWGIVGALWLYGVFTNRTTRAKILARMPILVLLVAGLCAVQLFPFLDLLLHSQRETGFRGSQWPMPPWGWANFILPLFRMFPSYHDVHAQPGQYWISTYYVSIGTLLLGIIALIKVRKPRAWLLGGVLLFSIWMALGERALLYKWLRAIVPGLGMLRFPIKFIVLAAFVLPLLGAAGLEYLLTAKKSRRRTIWIPTGILATAIVTLIIYAELNPFRYSRAFLTSINGLWRIAFLLGAAGLLARLQLRPRVLPLLFACIVADGLTHTTWQNPVAPHWVYEGSAAQMQPIPSLAAGRAMISPEAAEIIDHLKLNKPADDVMASRISLYCNLNLLDHVPKVDGFYAIYPRDMAQLQDLLYTGTNRPPAGLLDFFGVTQITTRGKWNTWDRRESALPLVTSPRIARTSESGVRALLDPSFNPREEVFLDRAGTFASASIDSIDWKPHRISFQATAPSEALAVVAQTFFHNWKAAVDGQPVPLWRANGAFQALRVPGGKHTVVLEYRDQAFLLGAILSFMTAAILAIFLLVCRPKPA